MEPGTMQQDNLPEHFISLRTYLETKEDGRWHAHDKEHSALADSIRVAESVLTRRLDGMNEIREQLNTQADTFLTKAEYSARHDDIERRIRTLEASSSRIWGYVAAGLIIIGVLEVLLRFVIK